MLEHIYFRIFFLWICEFYDAFYIKWFWKDWSRCDWNIKNLWKFS